MPYREENFFYTTGWSLPMAAIGAAVAPQINIASDAAFKAYYLTVSVRQGAAGAELIVANFAGDIQILDSQIGKSLFNIAGPIDAIRGDGQLPYNLAPPRIFAGNSTIICQIAANVVTRTQVCVTLHGAKLFSV